MSNQRKQIILNEILFWKQNKLLPEQYCDFLMTLYSEGNEEELKKDVSYKKAIKAKEQRRKRSFAILFLFIVAALLGLLFIVTEFVWFMSLVVGGVAILFMISAYKFAKQNDLIAPILQVAAALLIFGLSVKVSLTYFTGNMIVLYSLIIANCIMWTVVGIKLKQLYFILSGILGVIILIGFQLFYV